MVSEYSAETFPFQQGWERNENLSVLIPRHSKNLGEPVCAAPLSGPERSPKPPNREMTLPRRGDLLTTHGRPEIAPPPATVAPVGCPALCCLQAQKSISASPPVRQGHWKTLPFQVLGGGPSRQGGLPPPLRGTRVSLLGSPRVSHQKGIANKARTPGVDSVFHGYLSSGIKCYRNLWNVQCRFMCLNNSSLVCNKPADSHFILALISSWKKGLQKHDKNNKTQVAST